MSEGNDRLDELKELLSKPLIMNSLVVIFSLSMFVLTWKIIADWADLVYLPEPRDVYDTLIWTFNHPDKNLGITMWQNMFASLKRFVIGFVLSFLVAIPLGLAMGYSKKFDLISKPVIEVFRPIPPIAWVPFFLAVLGIMWGPIMVIFIGVLFPLISNIYFGVKSVEPILLDAARTQGASRVQMFTKVIFPYTIPFLMTGIRIGMGIGWMCIVAAEMLSVSGGGLGYYISMKAGMGQYTEMFAAMIVVAILGLLTTGLMQYLENVVNKRMGIR